MIAYPFFAIAVGLIFCFLFLLKRDRKGSINALLLKTLTSFMFILTAMTAFFANMQIDVVQYFALVSVGLMCGLIGDIMLDLKVIYKGSSSIYQFAGMTAFLIGHLFYLSALYSQYFFNIFPLIFAAILAFVIILVSKLLLKYDFREHTFHTYSYAFILSLMFTQSLYAFIASGELTAMLMAIGGASFLVSDLILVMTYYGGKDSRVYIITNHTFYYAAQFIIAMSILFK